MKRVLLVVPVFLAFFLVAPSPVAHACSCAQSTPAEAVERVDVVLRGTVVGTEDADGTLPLLDSGRPVTHQIAVSEVYKGAAAATTFVRSPAESSSCGIEVEKGREYVLFARQLGSALRAELCDGTAPADRVLVAEVEDVTGPGVSPQGAGATGSTPGATRPGDSLLLPLTVGVGAALVASALVASWWRRRRGHGGAASPEI